ncbi:hypothetical protein N7533_008875 [Penicillium manginii]|uniref:uncharacterized protein n=1 Tax=Penicillium manginii TaxID=203109 RepID=UPI0025471123|nr:uncharacterized protein N7533_008875 [Penicillium manginii]KAJ5744005.1 hypothetical protein N7533_008875 [Penicillium manginii]
MKFLCLHGAIGNVDNISIQLAPLQKDLGQDQSASFHYINAPVKITPPAGFEEYFGVGPHYRWADDGGAAEDSMISRVRQIPVGQNPEDVMRDLVGDRQVPWLNYKGVMEYLYQTLEENPDIGGIIGYSEGASMAATFILDEQRRFEEEGRGVLLADEVEDMIDVPTLHVVGANDPFRHGAYALYNVCDPDTAIFFDTGKGHTIPRSGLVINELANAVRDIVEKSHEEE